MTAFPVNRPKTIATAATAAGTVTIIALPSPESWAGQLGAYSTTSESPPANLILNDCASLADANSANEIMSIPFSVLAAGQTLPVPETSTGLTISAVPPAMAITIDV